MNLLTPLQVASMVQLDRKAIYRALEDGELRGFKPRGRWRVEEAEVRRWLEASRPTPRPAPPAAPVRSRPAASGSSMRAMLREVAP